MSLRKKNLSKVEIRKQLTVNGNYKCVDSEILIFKAYL